MPLLHTSVIVSKHRTERCSNGEPETNLMSCSECRTQHEPHEQLVVQKYVLPLVPRLNSSCDEQVAVLSPAGTEHCHHQVHVKRIVGLDLGGDEMKPGVKVGAAASGPVELLPADAAA